MVDRNGWLERRRIGFERNLASIVELIAQEMGAPKWHVWCVSRIPG